jgi:gas vesicle protein
MKTRISLLIVGSALTLAACADSDGGLEGTVTTPASGPEATTGDTSANGTALEMVTELQAEIDNLGDAISESETAEELNAAWTTLSTQVAASIAGIREDGTIAREEIESAVEEFQEQLDELDVEENVRTAWEELRSRLEQMMS